jgi:hypothetical protein
VFVAAVFDAPIQNKRSSLLFPIFDLGPPDALRYRDVDSHPRKLYAARGAFGLVVGEGLDGLRLAVDFSLPPDSLLDLMRKFPPAAPKETISSTLLAGYNER